MKDFNGIIESGWGEGLDDIYDSKKDCSLVSVLHKISVNRTTSRTDGQTQDIIIYIIHSDKQMRHIIVLIHCI